MRSFAFVFGLFILQIFNVNRTTWFPAKHTCPICNHENEFQEIGSYGGYIYHWPSKYQYIYWPLTDLPSVYCCTKCYYSTYMWDFDSVPNNKIDTIKAFLSTVKFDKKYKDYMDISMVKRLEIAENIYNILGRDIEFWCQFYRVIAYNYDKGKNETRAKESRQISLKLARNMLTDSLYTGQEKEILYIIAAMHNFTGQKDSALIYLDKAGLLAFKNKNWEEERVKELDDYFTELIAQYKEFIRKGEDNE